MRGIIVGTMFALLGLAACGDNGDSDKPVFAGASLTTDEDAPTAYTVEVMDSSGRALTLEAETPSHGTVTVEGLRLTYTPAPNYNGSDAFGVTISNGKAQVSAQITVTVTPVNDAPAAVADSFAGTEDTPLVRPASALLANDTDVDGDALTVKSVQSPIGGTVSIVGTDITFTPSNNFNGKASYQYTVTDGKATSTTTVMIDFGAVNDPPVAVDDTATTAEDTPINIPTATLLANDTDAEGQTLMLTMVGSPSHGTVVLNGTTITFTPDPNYNGTGNGAGSFDYTVSDGAATDTGTVRITINPVNDPPVAVDDSATTPEDTALQLTSSALVANDTDADGDTLTVTAVSNAVNGTVALVSGNAVFTPNANFSGTGSFDYTVSDGTVTDIGTVTVTVTPVNDPPVAGNDTATTAEDTPLVIAEATLLANDSDVDSGTLTITGVGGAVNGSVSQAGGNITFRPALNFNGTASFTYTVSDGSAIATGTVTVTVTPVNDPPVAVNDTASTPADTLLTLTHASLLANDSDVDGDPLSITAVQNAVNGAAVLGASSVRFTPSPGFTGLASFDYVVSDGTATAVGTVRITVTAGAICGDGVVVAPETCDDGNTDTDDGCSDTCTIEVGWTCTGEPSFCTPICGDGMIVGSEKCDDGNNDDTDGCTTKCVRGAICTVAALPGGDQFVVDPKTGHCYVGYNDDLMKFAEAEAACEGAGGYLATITSAAEQAFVQVAQNPAQNPWIGAGEDGNTTDAIFDWVTNEPFGYANFAPGEPDDDAGQGGGGDCLHLVDATGGWGDTSCNVNTFVVGRICEIDPHPCGDSVVEASLGEQCDDGNNISGDGCSATCTIEVPPTVVSTTPANAAASVAPTTTIAITFNVAMDPATLVAQPGAGACAGTIQVSRDDFASCIGLGPVALSAGNTIATAAPAPALAFGTTYKIRVTTGAQSAQGIPMAAAFTQAAGFTTAVDVHCAGGLVLSQIYGGGGNAGAPLQNDFIELHNPTGVGIPLGGLAVQYASAAGTSWLVTALPAMTLAPGGYFLIQEAAGAGAGIPLPTPDAMGAIAMASGAGKVALTSTATALSGACPTGANILDFVGYGVTANCSEGNTPTPAPSNTLSVQRRGGGCTDGNNNGADFLALAPAPRNTAAPGQVCSCVANETNGAAELDFCNLQFPASTSTATGTLTELIFGHAFEAGVTEAGGPNPIVRAEIGFGPPTANPQNQPGWIWAPATYNVQVGNDDEYDLQITAPAPGSYRYTARFSLDGTNWTYCDLDGAGSNAGLSFEPSQLGRLIVTP